MNETTVPHIPAGPPGYCGSIADELRRIAADLDAVAHLELPEPRGATFWMQPTGTDAEVIAGVDALGKAVLGEPGEPMKMSGGSYHYKAYGERGPVDVRFFRNIDPATAESVKAVSEAAAREAELAKLRARVAELEAERSGLAYSREADDPTPVSPARGGQPHVVAVTDDGLVDETPAEPVTVYFSFGYGQYDPDTHEHLLDKYVTIIGPSHEACREAMFASRYGRRWSFDYIAGTPTADEWIPRWTEHERIVLVAEPVSEPR